ncbi:MAG TPA: division/cell wall cluster transcriptional repressor MraZ [Patescibacteria group bacterium]|nr:division/cell wall cluster transcriptional repressor MraZ [Patescibacteria group bacterium]
MLSGQVEGKLSIKNQAAFPKQFRQEMGGTLIVTKGIDKCLLVVSERNWETLLEGTKNMPFTDKATRELQRFFFGNAFEIQLDKQGRFLMPEYLRLYAKIEREVVFVGVQRYIEIWSKTEWVKQQESIAKGIELLTINLTKSEGHE